MTNRIKFIKAIIVGAFGVLCVCAGILYAQRTAATEVRYVEVPVVVPVEVPVEVLKEVKVEVPVEVPLVRVINNEIVKERAVVVEKPVALREFASLEELKSWLADDDTNMIRVVFGGKSNSGFSAGSQDCDDYAYDLQKAAERDGYFLSIQVDIQRQHALNSAFIGNDVYFIEPQTDEVWLECYRDGSA